MYISAVFTEKLTRQAYFSPSNTSYSTHRKISKAVSR